MKEKEKKKTTKNISYKYLTIITTYSISGYPYIPLDTKFLPAPQFPDVPTGSFLVAVVADKLTEPATAIDVGGMKPIVNAVDRFSEIVRETVGTNAPEIDNLFDVHRPRVLVDEDSVDNIWDGRFRLFFLDKFGSFPFLCSRYDFFGGFFVRILGDLWESNLGEVNENPAAGLGKVPRNHYDRCVRCGGKRRIDVKRRDRIRGTVHGHKRGGRRSHVRGRDRRVWMQISVLKPLEDIDHFCLLGTLNAMDKRSSHRDFYTHFCRIVARSWSWPDVIGIII